MATDLRFDVFAVDRASRTFNNVGDSMDRLGKKSGGLGSKFAKFGKMAAAGAAVAGAAVAVFAVSAVKAAAQDQAAQARLAQTLKKTTGARKEDIAGVEDWIDKTSRATGVLDDELRPALSKLLIGGRSQKQAMADLSLAMDIAAASSKDLGTVTGAMQKAARGNTGSLGRLGIATKDAAGNTLSYKEILKEATKEMGGAAQSAANTYEGKMKRLNVAFTETKEALGAKLLPVLTKLADWVLNTGIPAMSRFGAWFSEHIMPTLRAVGAFIVTTFIPALVMMARKFGEDIAPKVQEVKAAFQEARPQMIQVWNVIKAIANFIITKALPIWAKYETFIAKTLLVAIKLAIQYFALWVKAVTGIANNVREVYGIVKDKFNAMVAFVKRLPARIAIAAIGLWDGLKNSFRSAINWIIGAWNRLEFKIPGFDPPGPGPSFGGFTLGVPDIPMLAAGGIVTSPTLAMIGERGPEAVIPLSRGSRGVGGDEYHFHLHGNLLTSKREAQDMIREALKDMRNAGIR